MKKLVLSAISALFAALLTGCAITPIVPLITNEPTSAPTEAPTEVPTEAPPPVPAPRPLSAEYDASSRTLYISGSSNYTNLLLPEEAANADKLIVEDDDFTLEASLYHYAEAYGAVTEITYTDFIDSTDKRFAFIRDYLSTHASAVYPEQIAKKHIFLQCGKSQTGWWIEDERVCIGRGNGLYHRGLCLAANSLLMDREFYYILALINSDSAGWEQLGFANYVGASLDPYSELGNLLEISEDQGSPYARALIEAGIESEPSGAKRLSMYLDAVSRCCLEYGLTGWGSTSESRSVKAFEGYGYSRKPEDQANSGDDDMSMSMAVSFVAWLDKEYGFDALSRFCFGQTSFDEAFNTDYQTAFTAWKAHIMEIYPEL